MLCESVLAELEATVPVEKRIPPPKGDLSSTVSSVSGTSAISSEQERSSTDSTVSAPPDDSELCVGAPRDFSGHAPGTSGAYDSAHKWILAALRHLSKVESDIVLPSFEPNDLLCSQIHATVSHWYLNRTIARDAGVIDHRPSELEKPPPQECLVKARGWLLRYINVARAKEGVSALADDKWGRKLAGGRADAKAVNRKTKELKAASGKLYHDKHDLAPTPEQVVAMCYTGFSADQHVHGEVLDALEAGMAIALYLPTGARGSELKRMHLQVLGHESIYDNDSASVFECLKLTAHGCKTKAKHLSQILAHSNPWQCGVGLLGISLLVRNAMYGAMPFTMQTNDESWMIIGSNVDTLDRRMETAFNLAGMERQTDDFITYLGRHFGTRLLQHAGGSAEGGAARRGHKSGATFNYSEVPLPDLCKIAGCVYNGKHFVPAHHHSNLRPFADAVLAIIFPELDSQDKFLKVRKEEVRKMGMKAAVKERTQEQLNDQERLARSIRFACRTALCCLVARPRTWAKWAIIESEDTVWQRATESNHRVVKKIFGFAGNTEARKAMDALAREVNRCENAEIQARKIAPEQVIQTEIVSGIQQLHEQNRQMHEQRMMAEHGELPPAFRSEVRPSSPPAPTVAAVTTGVRIKHKRESQDDVAHFSSWPDLGHALTYAKEELAPREKTESAKWRIIQREDGREDKSRDKQWRCYRSVAIAIGILMRGGKSYEDAVSAIQERFESFGVKPHTPFLKAINQDIGKMRSSDADVIAREVLGF